MTAYLAAVGSYLPPTTGIEAAVAKRRYRAEEAAAQDWAGSAVAGDTPAPEMALLAAQEAYKRCGRRPADTDLLLYVNTWHQGPDGWQPQYHLQRHLVGGATLAVQVQQGSTGMFGALALAARYLTADPDRQAALLVAADNFGTPLFKRWSAGPGQIAGDAATAALLTREPGFAELLAVQVATYTEDEELYRAGEPLFPPGATAGRGVDFGRRAAAYRKDVPTLLAEAGARLREVAHRALAEAGVDPGRVTRVAGPAAGRVAVTALLAALGLPEAAGTWAFARNVGQLGASDQIAALDHLLTGGELRPGDHVLLLGHGPGVTVAAAVVRIRHAPPWYG
ncbi:ketoacyl-ACP synthase III family protein [Phytohabitans houttuyneae]|uniref:Beta-ketoacyl-[acyl-carrier-protein] synthase III C-terminal domain-containing protein n=1 Tax=Phytohabitans houttuyneae TaxID=1076126 RepID=A0A6V8KJA7_9ACTN|nr:ketoacyl-ACP synthase III family protein [Phytohabitans houttuyneae]GFJ80765.1 hypothetical protein Phou_049450 [Phytohabitans houttuyneae]